jgi:hypothetical protein
MPARQCPEFPPVEQPAKEIKLHRESGGPRLLAAGWPCATNDPSWCKLESFSALRPDFLSRLLALAKFMRSRLPWGALGCRGADPRQENRTAAQKHIHGTFGSSARANASLLLEDRIHPQPLLVEKNGLPGLCVRCTGDGVCVPASPTARRGRRDHMKCAEATSCTGNPGSLLCPGKVKML